MKLVSSTGDFTHYVDSIEQEIREFQDTKFCYVNLEQVDAAFEQDGEEWRIEETSQHNDHRRDMPPAKPLKEHLIHSIWKHQSNGEYCP